MKTLRCALLFASIAAAAVAQTPDTTGVAQPNIVTLPAGTRIVLGLKNSINTRRSREGDGVYLEVTEPVAAAGRMVIPQGTSLQGRIRLSQRAGKLKGRAALQLTVDRMIYRNGYVVDFNSTLKSADSSDRQAVSDKQGTIKAESSIGRDAVLIGAGTLGGGLAGGLGGVLIGAAADHPEGGGRIGVGTGVAVLVIAAMLARGQDVQLEPGSSVEIELQRPVALDVRQIPEGSPANYLPPQRPQRPERQYREHPPMLPFPRFPF